MGILSHLIIYKLGKRRGNRRASERLQTQWAEENDTRDPECVNYGMFCMTYGSCDGQQCEYE